MNSIETDLAALEALSVPDQWVDIVERATLDEPATIRLSATVENPTPRRRIAVAAAVLSVLLAGLAGVALLASGRSGDAVTATARPVDQPALLDLDIPVQSGDVRTVSDSLRVEGSGRAVVLGRPVAEAGYRDLISMATAESEPIDFGPLAERIAPDPFPGAAVYVTEVDRRTIVEASLEVEETWVRLTSIASVGTVTELLGSLDRVPTQLGESIGEWEVIEVSDIELGASSYSQVTAAVDGLPVDLYSRPAVEGGPVGGLVLVAAEIERVSVDGRPAWFGPDRPVIGWQVPGGGSALLFADGGAAELTALAERVVERTTDEWSERGGTFPDGPTITTPPTTTIPTEDALTAVIPVVRGSDGELVAPGVSAPRPEIDGWEVSVSSYSISFRGERVVGWLLERGVTQVGITVVADGPQDLQPDVGWLSVELARDGIELRVDPEGALSLWREPGVGTVNMIAIEDRDVDLHVEVAEAISFVDVELGPLPLPEPWPEEIPSDAVGGDVDGAPFHLVTDRGGVDDFLVFGGIASRSVGYLGGVEAPGAIFAAIDGLVVVAVSLPDGFQAVWGIAEDGDVQVPARIETIGGRPVALVGIDPSANGRARIEVMGSDRSWTFDVPALPWGWVDGVLSPAG
ncbi:MAG: hypothetical protein AAGA99_03910 [Actinomycetota bacterium]